MTRPDLSTWLDPEHNRWSFLHVREIVPTGAVPPSAHPRALRAAHQPELVAGTFESNAGTQVIEEFLTASRTDSLTIVKGDELLLECPADEVPAAERIVAEEMRAAMTLEVPLDVSVHAGRTWAECEK